MKKLYNALFIPSLLLMVATFLTTSLIACGGGDDDDDAPAQGAALKESQFVGTWKVVTTDSNGGAEVSIVELSAGGSATVTCWDCRKSSENPIPNCKTVGNGTWEITKNSLFPNGALHVEVITAGSGYYGYNSDIRFSGTDKFIVGDHAGGVDKDVVWERYTPVNNAPTSHYGYWEFVSYSGTLRSRQYSLETESFTDEWKSYTYTDEDVCLFYPAVMFTKSGLPLNPTYNSVIVDWMADGKQLLFNMSGISHTISSNDDYYTRKSTYSIDSVEGKTLKLRVDETEEVKNVGLTYEAHYVFTYQRKSTFEYEL